MHIAAISATIMPYSTIVAPWSSRRTLPIILYSLRLPFAACARGAHAEPAGVFRWLEAGVDVRERVADALTECADNGDTNGSDQGNHDAVFNHRRALFVGENVTKSS